MDRAAERGTDVGQEWNGLVFGPVPSRRLGRSLGINNIPAKTCSYSCVYCQAGRTTALEIERRPFVPPERLAGAVRARVDVVRSGGDHVDYVSFVPDGEPTLDANLGRTIERLGDVGIPVAVLTNGSLLGRPDVRDELSRADWVSVKVDAVEEDVWRRIDRPHGRLRLGAVLEGLLRFADSFGGMLVTETMLVAGLNDSPEQLERLAGFLARLAPRKAYLSIPTRPPAESWVRAPGEERVAEARRILSRSCRSVEALTAFEGVSFGSTGRVAEDILATAAVHPIREEAMGAILERAAADWSLVRSLIAEGRLEEVVYGDRRFYRRKARAGSAGNPRVRAT